MKSNYLIYSILILFLLACSKNEPDPIVEEEPILEGPAFAESIYGVYNLYTLYFPYALKCTCEEPIAASVIAVDDETISFRGNDYRFKEKNEDDNTYHFFHSGSDFGNYLYDDHDLVYYECSDSLAYKHLGDGESYRLFGKKENGKICPTDIAPADFEHTFCSQGPENAYCHSTPHLSINMEREISSISLLSSDTENETLRIGVEFEFGFQLPTDASNVLLPGKYWIGEVPSQDKAILGMGFFRPYQFSVGMDAFIDGYLDVSKSGDEYTISFDFTCKGDGKWSGFYAGEIQ